VVVVYGQLQQWVWLAWALFRNKFPFLVEGLYVSLFVGDEEGGDVDGCRTPHAVIQGLMFLMMGESAQNMSS
jgi:hypothetical protein